MKSHVSDLLELATCVLYDAVAKCTNVPLDLRDLETIRSRGEHEGVSFYTITLPTFGKDFDMALSVGVIDSTHFRAFRKRGKAPVFLQGFFSQVFTREGRIYDKPDVAAIEGIRQISYAFKKMQLACTPERVKRALKEFATNEHVFKVPVSPGDLEKFHQVSRILWNDIFGNQIYVLPDVIPKHGPGATAERLSGNTKYRLSRWHDRLEPYFPLLDTAFVNSEARFCNEFQIVTIVDEADEQPVRVIPVPKTLKTPRIIAIEPVCMQYTQQALSKWLIELLERHPLTRGHVNFRDQSVNRALAISASKDGSHATIDLSSASDLVPYELAISMFDSVPDIRDAISSCRSMRAQLPSGDIISLRKFASMGSALCFPVEAMYFYTICVAAMLEKHNLPCTFLGIRKAREDVYVYGDDIIIPTDAFDVVTDYLHKYYCKVSIRKSFASGKFRESCGMDAFDGEEVTPTYIRQERPRNKQDTNALISWVATSNLFYRRGYWTTSNYLLTKVESILGKLPIVGEKCAGLGKHSFQRNVSIERWNRSYQIPEVRTWVATPVYRNDKLSGMPALLKCLLSLESSEESGERDVKHLERSALHGAVALKRRWTRPY